MEYEVVQKTIDCVIQGKYTECGEVLASIKFGKFHVGEWIQWNNRLAYKFKLAPRDACLGIRKQYEDLLQKIKGVFLTDELVNLFAVATHNGFYLTLMSELTLPVRVSLSDSCTMGQGYLQQTLKCVCDHYGVTMADSVLDSLTYALIDFTNKTSDKEYTGVYLLLYSCAINCLLNANFTQAKLLANYLTRKVHQMNTDNIGQVKSVYLLCHSHTEESISSTLGNLCKDLMIAILFLLQEWDHCLHLIGNCEENQQCLHMEFRYMKCWLYFRKNSYGECMKYADDQARKCVHDDNELAARFLNMVGCCLSHQGKYHSAIQKFQKALSTDVKYLLPLYNISLQYRHLGLFSAELECLNLLLSALQNHSSNNRRHDHQWHHNVNVPCSLLKGLGFLSGDISKVQVVYLLAKRCYQLHRYQKASKTYQELLSLITSEGTNPQCEHPTSNNLPTINIQQVYKEAGFCLLCAGYYEQCIQICDKFLEALGMDSSRGSTLSASVQSGRLSRPADSEDEEDFFGLSTEEKVVSELHHMKKRSQTCGSGTEYNRFAPTDTEYHLWILAVMFYKADALAHTVCVTEALECLNRLTDMIENQLEQNTHTAGTKKQKLEDGMDVRSEGMCGNSDEILELLQNAYINKSVLLMAEKKYTQVLQVSRLAIQLKPDCLTSLYTHSLALHKLGRQREACSTWLSHRKLDVRGDSLHLQHLLTKQKELLRICAERDEPSAGTVSSKDFLKLDIYCITYIRDKR